MTKKLFVLGLATLLLAGCTTGGTAQTVRLETNGMAFKTTHIEVEAGRPVKLEFVNADSVLHDFAVDTIPVKVKEQGHDAHAHAKETDLHVSAAAAKTGTVEFTPLEPGTYPFYCTVDGHKEAGMVGELVVKPTSKG
jgi:uncharacterized cupredoxin-like copper-binding protein